MNKQSQFWVNQLVKRSEPMYTLPFLQNPDGGYVTPEERFYAEELGEPGLAYALYSEPRKRGSKDYARNAGIMGAVGGTLGALAGGISGLRHRSLRTGLGGALAGGLTIGGISALGSLLDKYGHPEIAEAGDAQTVANALAERIRQV